MDAAMLLTRSDTFQSTIVAQGRSCCDRCRQPPSPFDSRRPPVIAAQYRRRTSPVDQPLAGKLCSVLLRHARSLQGSQLLQAHGFHDFPLLCQLFAGGSACRDAEQSMSALNRLCNHDCSGHAIQVRRLKNC